jgi:hypothetical protein
MTPPLSFGRGPAPPQCPDTRSLQCSGRPTYSFCNLQLYSLPEGLVECPLSFLRSSCCLAPRSLMPLLHFGLARRLFLNIGSLGVPCTTLSWVCLSSGFQYPTAGCLSPDWSSGALIVSTGALIVKLLCGEMVPSRVSTQISAFNQIPGAPYVYIVLQIR